MIDAIGLGETIGNFISIVFLLIVLGGCMLLFYLHKRFAAVVFLSIGLNLLSFFYSMGTSEVFLQVVNMIVWPIVNMMLLISLAVMFLKTKCLNSNNHINQFIK